MSWNETIRNVSYVCSPTEQNAEPPLFAVRLATWTPPLYFCPWKNPLSFWVCLLHLMRHRRGIPFVTLLGAFHSNWDFHAGKGKEWNTRKRSPWTCCCDSGDISHVSPFHCLGPALFVSRCLEEKLTVVGGNTTTRQRIYNGTIWCSAKLPFVNEREINARPNSSSFSPRFYQGDSAFSYGSGAGHLPHHLHNPLRLGPWHQRVITAWKLPASLGKLLNRLRR